jgi:hypothetical protein
MSDERKERQPIVVNIKLGAYRPPEAESVKASLIAEGCSCEGTMGKGTGGDCKCGSQQGAGE